MQMIDNVTGEVLVGEVRGDNFIVQDGPDFDPRFEVYGMNEVSPVVAALIADAVDFPTELDNAFSDADMEAREAVAQDIDEEREEAEIAALAAQLSAANGAYLRAINVALQAVSDAMSKGSRRA